DRMDVSGKRVKRRSILGGGVVRRVCVEVDIAQLPVHPRGGLATRTDGFNREFHRFYRSNRIAVKLADIGDTNVSVEIGTSVEHALEGRPRLVVAAELDERVAKCALNVWVVWVQPESLLGQFQRPGEVMTGRSQPACTGDALLVSWVDRLSLVKQTPGFRVKG